VIYVPVIAAAATQYMPILTASGLLLLQGIQDNRRPPRVIESIIEEKTRPVGMEPLTTLMSVGTHINTLADWIQY
jgi:hypothetical protein